jgi:hypothetical protein
MINITYNKNFEEIINEIGLTRYNFSHISYANYVLDDEKPRILINIYCRNDDNYIEDLKKNIAFIKQKQCGMSDKYCYMQFSTKIGE